VSRRRSPGDAALLQSARALRVDAKQVSRAVIDPWFVSRGLELSLLAEAAGARAVAAISEASAFGDVLATPANRVLRGDVLADVSAPSKESEAWLQAGVEPAFAAMTAREAKR
jgi:hypothetical protein